jgi:hypothetical protein
MTNKSVKKYLKSKIMKRKKKKIESTVVQPDCSATRVKPTGESADLGFNWLQFLKQCMKHQ